MNGSKSPGPTTRSGDSGDSKDAALAPINGHRSPSQNGPNHAPASPVPSVEGLNHELPDAPPTQDAGGVPVTANGVDDDAASEAETLIDSPVKRREAERKQNAAFAASAAVASAKSAKAQKSRIGSLPVPQDDEDEMDSTGSPLQSTEVSASKAASDGETKEEDTEMLDEDEDAEGSDDDDVLSSIHSSPRASQDSSMSRALSENPRNSRKDGSPTNSRKRKHRASSVDNLPSSKRRSMDPPARRRLRGMHSEDNGGKIERSPSPRMRAHRRAVSTQSGLDGTVDSNGRKRKNQFLHEPKSARGWEESDASSETNSRGADDNKRPKRGIGRSTSTPGGRSVGRGHKRHVNRYGLTKLAEACEEGDLALVKTRLESDPDALEVAEFAGNKPLQIAALNGNADVVAYLIKQGAQTDCANVDMDTPLIDASENGHLSVVKLLLEAGVDPSRQNKKGQQALDVVADDTDNAAGIRTALYAAIEHWRSTSTEQRLEAEEEESRHARPSGVASKELHFMARTYENLLKLVQNNDRTGVQEFLAARVPVDIAVIAAAARTGDPYLVNMLSVHTPEKKLQQKAEKPMLAVLGSSHIEMVRTLTQMYWFDPLWRNRQGKSWAEMAEEKQGPNWRQEKELFVRLSEEAVSGAIRRSSSPVTKRDAAARRKLAQQKPLEDESDDDDANEAAPTRMRAKTMSRRLMSRKDIRTAKGGGATMSEDSADGSSDEDAPAEPDDTITKPPDTPSSGPRHHLRSKSQSGSPEVTPRSLRKKRSPSFRSTTGATMPTVNEEEKNELSTGVEVAKPSTNNVAAEKARKDREQEAKVALELAKKADEKRKEDEAAEAEAKRVQEEIECKAQEEMRMEEERKAEEARREEEARHAEQARKDEAERLRLEKEREELRIKHRSEVLAALPRSLATLFTPEASSFPHGTKLERNWLIHNISPLRVLKSKDNQLWVLNLQAAALIGRQGLELFFPTDTHDFEQCLAATWITADLEPEDRAEVQRFLSRLPLYIPGEADFNVDIDKLTFDEENQRLTARYTGFVGSLKTLTSPDCKAKLRRVRLEDVIANIHPLLKDWPMEMQFAEPLARSRQEVQKQLETQGTKGFVGRMQVFWDSSRRARVVGAGEDLSSLSAPAALASEPKDGRGHGAQWTKINVRHEK